MPLFILILTTGTVFLRTISNHRSLQICHIIKFFFSHIKNKYILHSYFHFIFYYYYHSKQKPNDFYSFNNATPYLWKFSYGLLLAFYFIKEETYHFLTSLVKELAACKYKNAFLIVIVKKLLILSVLKLVTL